MLSPSVYTPLIGTYILHLAINEMSTSHDPKHNSTETNQHADHRNGCRSATAN